ncbi:MAG: tetratricopeptide repeat protein [Chloroflexi bacterium]|nr:tetratricopeptide repeat protein [Chloroflexota bacterium]
MPTPPRNPYIAGKALGDPRGFFGREDVFRVVETVLSSPDQNSVVLFGQRRIGKTSILLNLRSRLASSHFVPVYFDLMDRARKSLAEVSFELAATIAQELRLPQLARTDFDNEGRGFRDKFLPTVYTTLGDNRLVLLFDEFDVLNVGAEEKLAPTSAAFAFFPYLRDLMTNEPRLAFVFVVGRKAEELSIEFKSAFKASRFYRVSVLDNEAARALVRTAERDHLLYFTNAAVTRVLDLTARHPYFTQLICQLLFERAYANEPLRVEITPADVDEIVPKVLEAGENIFEWIWDGLPPAERVIFSVIASGTDEQTVITDDRLTSILQTQGIRILIRELELAPKTLVEREMLKQIDGGSKFFVELLRRWVVERKPLPKVKDELDRVVPLAETLYQGATGFYRRSDLESAIIQLQSALNVNPNHLKARLLLGDIYRAQGKFDDAVRELEEAYKIDDAGSRVALERALLQRATTRELFENAVRDYDRILTISPNSREAMERRIAMWIQRGEIALADADLETARTAFTEAKAIERVAQVDILLRKRELEQQVALAEKLTQGEEWEAAITVYQRLVEADPKEERWQDGLERSKQEQEIARQYSEGLGAMQQGKESDAQRAFANVIYVRPDYKDAAQMLTKAILSERGVSDPREQSKEKEEFERRQNAVIEHRKREEQLKLEELAQKHEAERRRRVRPRTLSRIGIVIMLHIAFYSLAGGVLSSVADRFISSWYLASIEVSNSIAFFGILGVSSGILLVENDLSSRNCALLDDGNNWFVINLILLLIVFFFASASMAVAGIMGLVTYLVFGQSIGFYIGFSLINSVAFLWIIQWGSESRKFL